MRVKGEDKCYKVVVRFSTEGELTDCIRVLEIPLTVTAALEAISWVEAFEDGY